MVHRTTEQSSAPVGHQKPEDASPLASEWRDIGTAPKDGTAILLTDAGVQEWTQVAAWEEYQFQDGSRWGWGRDDCTTYWHPDAFTHWMPLPEPPVSK